MVKKRALKDAVKDPVVRNKTRANHSDHKKNNNSKAPLKIIVSLVVGFACGLLTGRFIKII